MYFKRAHDRHKEARMTVIQRYSGRARQKRSYKILLYKIAAEDRETESGPRDAGDREGWGGMGVGAGDGGAASFADHFSSS